jgi:hypothetical protein
MRQYLLSVHMVEGEPAPSEADMQRAYAAVDAPPGYRLTQAAGSRRLPATGLWTGCAASRAGQAARVRRRCCR